MNKILLLNKPLGMSPLQAIKRYRQNNPEQKDTKLGYAGRLDPMAEGLLIILVGEENKKRKVYEQLPKQYVFQVVLGLQTDSYDTLGLVKDMKARPAPDITQTLPQVISSFIGKQTQPYPLYSAARVKGKPLYYWAREKKLSLIEIPQKEIEIYSMSMIQEQTISLTALQEIIMTRIPLVQGIFRQEEILKRWDTFFNTQPQIHLPLLTFQISCSSGTYVRSIAQNLGEKLGTGALTLSIKRTSIGNFHLTEARAV